MDIDLFKKWRAEGLISDPSLTRAEAAAGTPVFSLYYELRTLLYLAVTLLSSGFGVLIYKNIDSIGHSVILAFIALVCAGCYFYCLRKKAPFSRSRVTAPNLAFDYVLLLGNVSFLTLIGYAQFQFNLFGTAYGLALFIPTVFLFVNAYWFDHLGILSLAITSLAAWAGIALTPLRLLQENPFSDPRLMYTGLALGVLLTAAGYAGKQRDFKPHFSFTYHNFSFHLLFIAALTGLFVYDHWYLAWFLLTIAVGVYFFRVALVARSMYFLVFTILYGYVALTYVLGRFYVDFNLFDNILIFLPFFYFIGSSIGIIRLLKDLNRKMKSNDRL